jgi:hypothetical protein
MAEGSIFMPLVFVHGVANRPSAEQAAAVRQRDALFRSLVFDRNSVTILNPDWGSFGVQFDEDLPWLPKPSGNEAFDGGNQEPGAVLDDQLKLGDLAARDAEQAIDLVAMAALDAAIRQAAELDLPEAAAQGEAFQLAEASAAYFDQKDLAHADAPTGIAALATATNAGFADALDAELSQTQGDLEGFGIGDTIRGAINWLDRAAGNVASDVLLRFARPGLSRGISFFLGDIFVYLRGRDQAGPAGTRAKIFAPVIADLIAAHQAPRVEGEPLVVVAHSLGGVILYDILTDAAARAELEAGIGGAIAIDALFTVGSQPGFFADLGLFPGGRPAAETKLPLPVGVATWMNVFDFTDVFSFRCAQIFDGVKDFGYDTVTDVVHAHGAYFLRPSFYRRLRARLAETGHP